MSLNGVKFMTGIEHNKKVFNIERLIQNTILLCLSIYELPTIRFQCVNFVRRTVHEFLKGREVTHSMQKIIKHWQARTADTAHENFARKFKQINIYDVNYVPNSISHLYVLWQQKSVCLKQKILLNSEVCHHEICTNLCFL